MSQNQKIPGDAVGRLPLWAYGKGWPGLAMLTLLRPVGGPPLKQPYGHFRDGPPTGRVGLQPSPTPLDTPRRTPMILRHVLIHDDIRVPALRSLNPIRFHVFQFIFAWRPATSRDVTRRQVMTRSDTVT
jgi:hypothetical protein